MCEENRSLRGIFAGGSVSESVSRRSAGNPGL
jgi:hypothetical protein